MDDYYLEDWDEGFKRFMSILMRMKFSISTKDHDKEIKDTYDNTSTYESLDQKMTEYLKRLRTIQWSDRKDLNEDIVVALCDLYISIKLYEYLDVKNYWEWDDFKPKISAWNMKEIFGKIFELQ